MTRIDDLPMKLVVEWWKEKSCMSKRRRGRDRQRMLAHNGMIDCTERQVMAIAKPIKMMQQAQKANNIAGVAYRTGLRQRIDNPQGNIRIRSIEYVGISKSCATVLVYCLRDRCRQC